MSFHLSFGVAAPFKKITCIVTLCAAFACLSPATLQAQNADGLQDEYKFQMGITYNMTMEKGGRNGKTNQMTMWFAPADYAGFDVGEQKGMAMVYDFKSEVMVTFMEAQKMGMIIDMKKIHKMVADQAALEGRDLKEEEVKITKTGRTENILGYKCAEYSVVSDKSTGNVWVTSELGAGFGNYMKNFSMIMQGNQKGQSNLPNMKGLASGVMLRMETKETSSGDVSRFDATAVNKEGKIIKTAEYKIMKMPGQ
ncbi:DUF4412 domain-containing protein [Flavihumibacter stibioxidans]|uniref:DUF4412 domain-containing protein n=1 Tax=Flavihumibacter stibioxidans TaxID=1834163 RepID=A0ABR7M8L2_9BACT|nr:DUF4412 domain-containing protein [Flavihumibacter stibioxidans]MBC6491370.1 hypothetical protein [Flavihumibacter stibioxidans]